MESKEQQSFGEEIVKGKKAVTKNMFKWGIIGSGSICNDFVTVLKAIKNCQVVAVSSRTEEGAKEFAQKFGIPKVFNSTEELAKDKELDCVYIGVPHNKHHEAAMECIKNKIPVLCEKPLTLNASQAEEMVQLAKANNTFLMEAMWTRFIPALLKAKELTKEIGDLRLVTCDISYNSWNRDKLKERAYDPNQAGGAILDVGSYGISFASWMYGGVMPTAVKALAQIADTGVDESAIIALKYGESKLANITCSVHPKAQGSCWIVGEQGTIHIHGPGWQHAVYVTLHKEGKDREDFKFQLPDIKGEFMFERGELMLFEALEVMQCIEKGQTESKIMSLQESVNIMKTLDLIRREINVKYPHESEKDVANKADAICHEKVTKTEPDKQFEKESQGKHNEPLKSEEKKVTW